MPYQLTCSPPIVTSQKQSLFPSWWLFDTLTGDLGGGLPAQFRVRSGCVVVMPPGGQHAPGMSQRSKQRLVEAFVAQATVEALDQAVLHWLDGRDAVPLDPPLLGPAQDALPRQQIAQAAIAELATLRHRAATARNGSPCGSHRPVHTPDARSPRDAPGHERRLPAWRRTLPKNAHNSGDHVKTDLRYPKRVRGHLEVRLIRVDGIVVEINGHDECSVRRVVPCAINANDQPWSHLPHFDVVFIKSR